MIHSLLHRLIRHYYGHTFERRQRPSNVIQLFPEKDND